MCELDSNAPVKRMRVFAGPNGSGKTTILKNLQERNSFSFGVYVNADDIERNLRETNTLDFTVYKLRISQESLQDYFRNSTFSPKLRGEINLWEKLLVVGNVLSTTANIDSYLAADLAEFIRQNLFASNLSFSYETVMSHPDKIAFMEKARKNGYRVYLYFVATEDPMINIGRVEARVEQKGHGVEKAKITKRYFKSLEQLEGAIQNSDRAFLWDNSKETSFLFAEIENGNRVSLTDSSNVPAWFIKYLPPNPHES